MSDFRKQMVIDVAKALHSYGYKVHLSALPGATHGFFTDGTRVVSFQYDLGGVRYGGNYSTDKPRETGTGWLMSTDGIPGAYGAESMLKANAPHWAVGSAKVQYTTPEQYLKMYASSRFEEFKEE